MWTVILSHAVSGLAFTAFETTPRWKKRMPRLRSHVNLCLHAEGGIKGTYSGGGSFPEPPRLSVNFTAFVPLEYS